MSREHYKHEQSSLKNKKIFTKKIKNVSVNNLDLYVQVSTGDVVVKKQRVLVKNSTH